MIRELESDYLTNFYVPTCQDGRIVWWDIDWVTGAIPFNDWGQFPSAIGSSLLGKIKKFRFFFSQPLDGNAHLHPFSGILLCHEES